MKKVKKYYMCEEISEYGIANDRVDYGTLAKVVGDMVICNNIAQEDYEELELENGTDYNEEDDYYYDIFQYFIIDYNGADFLKIYTEEIVYYDNKLDVYVWGITHCGTGWDYVLTNIPIKDNDYIRVETIEVERTA